MCTCIQAVHTDGGPGKGEAGRGAGHGGQGGRITSGPNVTIIGGGLYYGDVETPIMPGSNGVYNNFVITNETVGGGVLKFNIANTAYIDGK